MKPTKTEYSIFLLVIILIMSLTALLSYKWKYQELLNKGERVEAILISTDTMYRKRGTKHIGKYVIPIGDWGKLTTTYYSSYKKNITSTKIAYYNKADPNQYVFEGETPIKRALDMSSITVGWTSFFIVGVILLEIIPKRNR